MCPLKADLLSMTFDAITAEIHYVMWHDCNDSFWLWVVQKPGTALFFMPCCMLVQAVSGLIMYCG